MKQVFDPITLEILWRRLISIVDEADSAAVGGVPIDVGNRRPVAPAMIRRKAVSRVGVRVGQARKLRSRNDALKRTLRGTNAANDMDEVGAEPLVLAIVIDGVEAAVNPSDIRLLHSFVRDDRLGLANGEPTLWLSRAGECTHEGCPFCLS